MPIGNFFNCFITSLYSAEELKTSINISKMADLYTDRNPKFGFGVVWVYNLSLLQSIDSTLAACWLIAIHSISLKT